MWPEPEVLWKWTVWLYREVMKRSLTDSEHFSSRSPRTRRPYKTHKHTVAAGMECSKNIVQEGWAASQAEMIRMMAKLNNIGGWPGGFTHTDPFQCSKAASVDFHPHNGLMLLPSQNPHQKLYFLHCKIILMQCSFNLQTFFTFAVLIMVSIFRILWNGFKWGKMLFTILFFFFFFLSLIDSHSKGW